MNKIALVIERFDPRLGGSEHSTLAYARWLLGKGLEVHAVSRCFGPEIAQAGIIPHVVEAAPGKLAYAHGAADRLSNLNVDVVHDMGVGWFCDVLQPRGGSRRANFSQSLATRPWPIRKLNRMIAPLLPRHREYDQLMERQYRVDGRVFVALSQMVKRHFQEYHQIPADHIRLVYNGIDLERFCPQRQEEHRHRVRGQLNVPEHEVLLFIAAHNFPLKGVPTLIRSTGLLARQGLPVRLAIAGGKRFGRYQRLAQRCGAGNRVHFLGSVADTVPYYAAADVYVHPTYYDPCSRGVLEALASGLPVITSQFNGAGELVTEGVEGHIIADPGDAQELASRLQPLFDHARREQMGLAARRLAEGHSLEHAGQQMLRVYAELQSAGRPAYRGAA